MLEPLESTPSELLFWTALQISKQATVISGCAKARVGCSGMLFVKSQCETKTARTLQLEQPRANTTQESRTQTSDLSLELSIFGSIHTFRSK